MFLSPEAAEVHYNIGIHMSSLSVAETPGTSTQTEDNFVAQIVSMLDVLPESEQLQMIGQVLRELVLKMKLEIYVPNDFVSLSVSAIQHLKVCERSNILYGLAKGFGTKRSDNSDSLIPAKRMPTGLLEYLTTFFTSSHLTQVMYGLSYKN